MLVADADADMQQALKVADVKDKVLLLADHFRKAVKELNSKKDSDTEK